MKPSFVLASLALAFAGLASSAHGAGLPAAADADVDRRAAACPKVAKAEGQRAACQALLKPTAKKSA